MAHQVPFRTLLAPALGLGTGDVRATYHSPFGRVSAKFPSPLSSHATLPSAYAELRPPVRRYTILHRIWKLRNKCSAVQMEAGGTSHGTGAGILSNAGSKLVDLAVAERSINVQI